jgi:hypothetical protein
MARFPKEKSRERRDQQQDDIQNVRATRISASSKTAQVWIRAKNGGALSTNQESIRRKTCHWSSTQIKKSKLCFVSTAQKRKSASGWTAKKNSYHAELETEQAGEIRATKISREARRKTQI